MVLTVTERWTFMRTFNVLASALVLTGASLTIALPAQADQQTVAAVSSRYGALTLLPLPPLARHPRIVRRNRPVNPGSDPRPVDRACRDAKRRGLIWDP